MDQTKSESKGLWIGIDLGTSNCTAAVWDLSLSRCKVIRLGYGDLARPPLHESGKGGTIVPSAVLFCDNGERSLQPQQSKSQPPQAFGDKERDANICALHGVSTHVGYKALQLMGTIYEANHCAKSSHDKTILKESARQETSMALVTSVKRVVGMTSRQARELQSSNPYFWNSLPFQPVLLGSGLDSNTSSGNGDNMNGDNCAKQKNDPILDILDDADQNMQLPLESKSSAMDGVAIRIRPLPRNQLLIDANEPREGHSKNNISTEDFLVTPLQITTILLRAIRIAANHYFQSNKGQVQAPGFSTKLKHSPPYITDENDQLLVQNCIIGVPAHYSQAQRVSIQNAAKSAGFEGYVGVMTESTAAAMAYGLFVSPKIVFNASESKKRSTDDNGEHESNADNGIHSSSNLSKDTNGQINSEGKTVLVFDMGGGTTDVTIAMMDAISDDNIDRIEDQVRFRAVATSGNPCLGGDNVDELLARYLWKRQMLPSSSETEMEWKASNHQDLIRQCRRAKEELCGNDNEDDLADPSPGVDVAYVALQGRKVSITRQEFDSAIQPLIQSAERVVDEALASLEDYILSTTSTHSVPKPHHLVHEVVLVGGSSRLPTLQQMLRRKFPPPIPPDLCRSIPAETAVAQGLAIRAAMVSGKVPMWELRNALMLDVLPHSIGVWVSGGEESLYDNIVRDGESTRGKSQSSPFEKGDMIQMNSKKGHYVSILQKDTPLPSTGNATFTLANEKQPGVTIVAVEQIAADTLQCMGVFNFLLHQLEDPSCLRHIKVGMKVETDGKFVVSIFDESDPEHREKRRLFLMKKARDEGKTAEEAEALDDLNQFYSDEEKESQIPFSGTEIGLVILCAVLFAFYVGIRVAFSDIDFSHENDEL